MSRRPKDIKKTKLDHTIDVASAALQTAVPFAGGLASYLEKLYPSQQNRLITELAETLKAHAEDIETIRCDVDKLTPLVNQLMVNSLQTPSETKRAAYRAILLNYAAGKDTEEHALDLYTQLVASVTELGILILQVAENPEEVVRARGLWERGQMAAPDVALEDVIDSSSPELSWAAVQDLSQKGLLEAMQFTQIPEGNVVNPLHLRITELGRRFLEWITFGAKGHPRLMHTQSRKS